MLVLGRKADEDIVLPSLGVIFKVQRVGYNSVRIGIKADKSVPIVRREVLTEEQLAELHTKLPPSVTGYLELSATCSDAK